MRALLSRLLLAVAVVLFQHGAVAHVLMHVGEAVGHHEEDGDFHLPHGCDACHAYVAADGGKPPAVALVVPACTAGTVAADLAVAAPVSEPPYAFPIRAPPAHP